MTAAAAGGDAVKEAVRKSQEQKRRLATEESMPGGFRITGPGLERRVASVMSI